MIRFIDLIRQREFLNNKIEQSILKVVQNSNFIQGEEVKLIEEELANFTGTKCVSVANGTDALYIALLAHGIKEGDEVLIPSFTWVSTAETICQLKAKPVFVDIDDNFNIDIKKMTEKITENTKAIMPVSMFGRCPDLNKIQTIALEHNLKTIEDAAQSFGAKSLECMSCSVLDISTTSFFPAKPLGCYGDGGAIFSTNEGLFEKCKIISKHGQKSRYEYVDIGVNSRLDTIQASILLEKLKIFEDEIKNRNIIAKMYNERLKNNNNIKVPDIPDNANRSVWAQYTLLLDSNISEKRESIMKKLKELGVPTALYYPVPLHTTKPYRGFESSNLEKTVDFSKRVISLPMHPYLTEQEVDFICDAFNKVAN